ncbi:hypothetical protein [Bradyrhizobium sp. WD16]|uniref:hypothetical protein n=1 Tax=Bradyrhizobium sp. WD16 TaxID=1521768 RepID=UPI0020A26B9E|nr:hypothetical protein [Bradyrhizobium sp. WD16]
MAHAHPHPVHDHAPHAHPAQAAPWSMLALGVGARLMIAIAASAVLWATVWLALQ